MILKNNMAYFNSGESYEKIKEYAEKLWKFECENELFSSSDNIIKKIKAANFYFINDKEKETIIKLLNKEKKGCSEKENEIFEQKFFFFFALIDFILREKITHSFLYDDQRGFFRGEFRKELEYIQNVNECNPISFYSDENRKPKINFNVKIETFVKNIGKNFISDMNLQDYLDLFEVYNKFKKSIEES